MTSELKTVEFINVNDSNHWDLDFRIGSIMGKKAYNNLFKNADIYTIGQGLGIPPNEINEAIDEHGIDVVREQLEAEKKNANSLTPVSSGPVNIPQKS